VLDHGAARHDQQVLQDDALLAVLHDEDHLVAAAVLVVPALVAGGERHGLAEVEIDHVLALHREDGAAVTLGFGLRVTDVREPRVPDFLVGRRFGCGCRGRVGRGLYAGAGAGRGEQGQRDEKQLSGSHGILRWVSMGIDGVRNSSRKPR